MKNRVMFALTLVALVAACGRGDKAAAGSQQSYETVQEGSAAGVTSTIHGPGEVLPPITGTNADTTSAFALNPNSVAATAPQPGYETTPMTAMPGDPNAGSYGIPARPAPRDVASTPAPTTQPRYVPPASPERAEQTRPSRPVEAAPAPPVETETAEPAEAAPAENENTEPAEPSADETEAEPEQPPSTTTTQGR